MKNTFVFQLPIKNIFILQYIENFLLDAENIDIFFTTNSTVVFQIFLLEPFASIEHYFHQFETLFENYESFVAQIVYLVKKKIYVDAPC